MDDSQLSSGTRHTILENLVKKLFPHVDIQDIEELTSLSRSVQNGDYTIVHFQLPPAQPGVINQVTTSTSAGDLVISEYVYSTTSNSPQATQEERSNLLNNTGLYERVLQNPSGMLSYFGHSSSMAYVRKMRELLLALTSKFNPEPLAEPQQSLRDSFIEDRYAHTMGDSQDVIPAITALDGRPTTRSIPDANKPNNAGSASARLAKLLNILPDRNEMEDLVELFFVHVHANMPLFHRSAFETILERLRSPSTTAVDVGWAVCVRLVVAFGCESRLSSFVGAEHPDSARLTSLGKQLVSNSLEEISQLMLSSTLQSVTALTLFSLYLSFANERNAAWILSGCAIRMAIGLGLHRSEDLIRRSKINLSFADNELRKQIWCSLYIHEQYTSSLFGRPSAVDGIEILVDLPKESILDLGFYQPPGVLSHDISLARIVSEIRKTQTDQSLHSSNDLEGLPNLRTCDDLLKQLDTWEQSLPFFLKFTRDKLHQIYPNHLRQLIMMHIRFQYAKALLTRPFLLKSLYITHVLKSADALDQRIARYRDACFLAASESCMLIRCLWDTGHYNGRLWLDGVLAYQCSLLVSLFMLDRTRSSDDIQWRKLQQMVEQMQEVLQKGPGNRTMTRLVQISRDFTKIVKSVPLCHRETGAPNDHDPLPETRQNPGEVETTAGIINTPVPPVFNWETFVAPDWFSGDSLEGNYWFEVSMSEFNMDNLEF